MTLISSCPVISFCCVVSPFNRPQISSTSLPHHFSHPTSFFFLSVKRPRRRLRARRGDNSVIPPESPALSRQFHYNARLGSVSADLSKHKRYEIRLSVYNAVGEGPISAPQEVFVGEAGMCRHAHKSISRR